MKLTILSGLALCALASSASADFLTGRLLDAAGNPIPNADLDFKNNGSGGRPTVSGDFTDANGFFNVAVPNGNYDILFIPPPPPLAVAMSKELSNVNLVGTLNLGDVVLPTGVAVSGRVLTSGGLPVVSVNIDVIDQATGNNVDLYYDTTNALGQFALTVPLGAIDFRINPGNANPSLAATHLETEVLVNTNLGDLVLQPGFNVSGVLIGQGGLPLSNVDIDVFDASGDKLYTPNDNSQATGFFTVKVPNGTFEVRVCPTPATRYVAVSNAVTVSSAAVNLGVINLVKGFYISGHVSSSLAANAAGVDIDVVDMATGLDITLCTDNTNGAGNYTVVVPAGVYKVNAEPTNFNVPLGAFVQTNVAVGGDIVLNAVLPDCPFPVAYGAGTAGTGGLVPVLSAPGGTPRPGNGAFGFRLENALPGSVGVLAIGFAPASLPFFGGTALVDPTLQTFLVVRLTGPGAVNFPLPVPITGAYAGLSIYAQSVVFDGGAPAGWAFSNGVSFTICQ